MKRALLACLSGALFAVGLQVAGMTSTQNVRGFLDVLGDWDPRLMGVMGSALAVVALGNYLLDRRAGPSVPPANTRVDVPLLLGAAAFGVGWGLVGLCPGPMFVVLGSLRVEVWMFAATFVAGMAIGERTLQRARQGSDSASG